MQMKQKRFRKGEFGFVGITVLGAVILVVLYVFFGHMVGSGEDIGKRQICKRSVEMSTALGSIHIEPKTIEGKVYNFLHDPYGNAVEVDCSTSYLNFKTEEPDAVKEIIANEMVSCWDEWGEGKLECFDTKDNNYCVVCSRLTFEEEVEVNNFIRYLRTHLAPYKDKTYWEYFMGAKVENFEPEYYDNSELRQFDTFKTDSPMAVMFIMEKDAFPERKERTISGMRYGSLVGSTLSTIGYLFLGPVGVAASIVTFTAGGATIGYVLGSDPSAEWDARILLWDYENIKDLNCTQLESKTTPLEVVQKE